MALEVGLRKACGFQARSAGLFRPASARGVADRRGLRYMAVWQTDEVRATCVSRLLRASVGTCEQVLQFVGVERLLVEEGFGEGFDRAAVALQQVAGGLVAAGDHLLDLVVDAARGGLARRMV